MDPFVSNSSVETIERAPARGQLDRSLFGGIAWTGGVRWASQIISWAGTLVAARLLTPADFGLVGAANVYIGLVEQVSEFGLGVAIVRGRVRDALTISNLNAVAICLGIGFTILSMIAAFPLAAFFRETELLRPVLMSLALTFVFAGIRIVPRALLAVDLQFKRLAVVEAAEVLASTVLIVVLALLGWRHWAIVSGLLGGSAASTALAVIWRRNPIRWPRPFSRIREPLSYGLHITGTRVAWYAYNQADFAVVARMLGKVALGFYSFGWQLASIPVQRISALVSHVAAPGFAKVRDDTRELGRYFLLLTEALALTALPISIGMTLVADSLVRVALGDTWAPAARPLQLLGLYAAVRTLSVLYPNVLQVVGKAREVFVYTVVMAVVLPVAFIIGAWYAGTTGVAAAWMVCYPIGVLPLARLALKVTGLTLGRYVRALAPPVASTALMAVAVLLGRVLGPEHRDPLAGLLLDSVVGAGVYAILLLTLHRHRVDSIRNLWRRERRGGSARAPETGAAP